MNKPTGPIRYVTINGNPKRILLIDGEIVGAVNRVPAIGDSRSNMHVGGTPEKTIITKTDQQICNRISGELKNRELFFVGIDVIGNYITEISGKKAAVVSFLSGSAKKNLTPKNCYQVGIATAKLHTITEKLSLVRKNKLSVNNWKEIFQKVKR